MVMISLIQKTQRKLAPDKLKSFASRAYPDQLILAVLIQFVVLIFIHPFAESSQIVSE